MPAYQDLYWPSADGLRLHARDWPGPAGDARPPVLCLAGLTRNARDFDAVAARVSPGRRVIAANLRGRGGSEAARDPMTYVPATYVADILTLLGAIGAPRVVAVGTSLGGIVAMMLAQAAPGRIAGALLNDIGPAIEPEGLARIRGHVGRASVWPTWMHAARCVAELNAALYPDHGIDDWLAMAKRLYRINSAGRIVLDYDLKIAEPFRVAGAEAPPDLWSALDALAGVPVAIVRGERSDILSAATAQEMAARLPGADLVTVPRVGHAPMLTEAPAAAALDRLLARVTA